MATIDFTLDDFRRVVREESARVFDEKFPSAFATAFDKAFAPAFDIAFMKAFKPAFHETFEPYADAIQADFTTIHQELAEIKSEIKGHARLLRQHSQEIMDLKARA